jgi:histidyl-tRNA synthetase
MNDNQTLKGFRDFLPAKMAIRTEAVRRLREVFEKYGFGEVQTPAIEYQSVLLGKYGEEAEKLMYLFEDPGKRKVGLRYDLTVPLSRLVAGNQDLPKPFKRYQIQPSYRAENTQKGRYREFTQCDVDIVGSVSPLADAEILAIINDSLIALGFSDYEIKINSRTVLYDQMKKAGISEDKFQTVAQSIDKLDKKTKEEVVEELANKGFDKKTIDSLFENISKAKPDEYLDKVIKTAEKMGVKDSLVFSPTLSRGLDYYTGPIFETLVKNPKIGSVTGGGRYDKLLKQLGGPDLPAVGTTIGLDRVCDVIEELNLWPDLIVSPSQVLVTIFSPELSDSSLEIAQKLRDGGVKTEIYLNPEDKLEKQLKYANNANVPWVVIVGPEEIENQSVVIKNMASGKQETIKKEKLSEFKF